jgi:hypothetical protein
MSFRKLRIAWSVGCGVAGVLLITLWVRSHWRCDSLVWGITKTQGFYVGSQLGETTVRYIDYSGLPPRMIVSLFKWKFQSSVPHDTISLPSDMAENSVAGLFVQYPGNGLLVGIPYWFPVLLSVTFAAVPWFPWSKRFSLRTLLVVTTLVAMVLGLAVWSVR